MTGIRSVLASVSLGLLLNVALNPATAIAQTPDPAQVNPPSGQLPAAPESPESPTTMFPHSAAAPWWISGQSNIIFQAHPGFHSPYAGVNSLRGGGEYKTSLLGTLFLGYQPFRTERYNTDLIFDLESSGGRGISEALGLAGFTNLDVVRNPNLGPVPYPARYQIHQTIGFTNEMTDNERGPFTLAPHVPVRRLDLRVGKISLSDIFDLNSVGSDSHLQFTNWTIDNNGAWDYAADTRGYTIGGVLEYQDRNWAVRYGIAAMPVIANGIDLDYAFSRARGQNIEFELRRSLIAGHKGVTRILSYVNVADMGNYREANNAFLADTDGTNSPGDAVRRPDITLHRQQGRVKYGFGFNNEQEVTANLRVFSRAGWDDGATESFCYTEVDQTISFGGDYAGAQWHRPLDKFGTAFVSNAIKSDHQEYLQLGGLGFLLGDGQLNYGRENTTESYYNAHAWRGLYFALGLSHIDNPGYNRDRGPVWVPSLRMHVDY